MDPLDTLTPLNMDSIRGGITGEIGRRLIYVEVVNSTNGLLEELPIEQLQHGLVAITDFQEAGRGRSGRTWAAPRRSSLLLSVLVAKPPHARASDGVLVATLAVADAIHEETGLTAAIKWPNDVLIDGRKVCGILGSAIVRDARPWLVLGIGLNANFVPREIGLDNTAITTLLAELGHRISREGLALALFRSLDLWYRHLISEPNTLFASWSGKLDTIGREVTVRDAHGSWKGKATGVQRDGGLVVEKTNGALTIVHAGDVSIAQN